jgi:hypothetical protein
VTSLLGALPEGQATWTFFLRPLLGERGTARQWEACRRRFSSVFGGTLGFGMMPGDFGLPPQMLTYAASPWPFPSTIP